MMTIAQSPKPPFASMVKGQKMFQLLMKHIKT